MNNFFLNRDPLLNQNPYENVNPMLIQQMPNIKDNVGELDRTLKGLSSNVVEKLNNNPTFVKLSSEFQASVQEELLLLVRNKLNMNNSIINNVNEQMKIIEKTKKKVESEKEESMTELNDYMKNYSHLTFDEYKRMKNGEHINNNNTKKKR